MRGVLAWLLLAGCDRVFFLDTLPDPSTLDARTDSVIDSSDGAVMPGCPADFVTGTPTGGSSYKVMTTAVAWGTARAACKELTGQATQRFVHLAVIPDFNELMAVQLLPGYTGRPWIGAIDLNATDQQAVFQWVTNEQVFGLPWDPLQPDNIDSQNCVTVLSQEGVDNDYCNLPHPYVCECDLYEDTL